MKALSGALLVFGFVSLAAGLYLSSEQGAFYFLGLGVVLVFLGVSIFRRRPKPALAPRPE